MTKKQEKRRSHYRCYKHKRVIRMEEEGEKERKSEVLHRKARIPVALREQVWISKMGRSFEGKCCVSWCNNMMTVFDFQSGHNIPESKGGKTTLENLIPICSRCNLSMGNQYTIDEWCRRFSETGSVAGTAAAAAGQEGMKPKEVVVVKKRGRFWCM